MCLQYVQGVAGAPRARAPVGGLVPTSPATVGVRDLRPSLPPGPSCWGFADLTDLSQRSHPHVLPHGTPHPHVPHRLRPQSETTAFEFVRSHKSFPQRPCLWLKQTSIFADNSKVSFLERTMETSWEFENTETPKKMADTDILTVRRDHSGRVSLFTPGHFGLGGDLRSDMSPKSIL